MLCCFIFHQFEHMVNMAACPLHGTCNFKTAKCYFCFSCIFCKMYVFIVNMYMSRHIDLFFCLLYLLLPSKRGHDHVITLGQQSSQVKICYSRDHLLSQKNSVSPIPYSLCAQISSLGIPASNHLCITRKSRKRHRKRHRKRRSKISPILQIKVVPISSSRTPNRIVNSALTRANLINVPILQSFSESHFSNNSLRIGCFNARSIGPSKKRSEINHFIFDNGIDVFFLVKTWLKDSGDEPKIADVTPIGYAARSFPRLNRGGGLAIIARSHILQHIAFKSSFSFEHHSFELFQATLSLEKRSVNHFCLYRPPPNRKNKLTDSLFVQQLLAFMEYCNSVAGCLLILGDFNFHIVILISMCLKNFRPLPYL